jgi:hypothetical protein
LIVVEDLREVARDFVSQIPGFGGPEVLGFQLRFQGPPAKLIPGPGVLATYLMLIGWIERQGWSGAVFSGLRNRAEVLPTPVIEPKFFGLDWYALTDELDWDLYLDGGLAIADAGAEIERTSDVNVLVINGKDEIYVVGEAGRSRELVALLQSWAGRVAPFFIGGEEA